jgi:hypothetical protein
VLVLVICVCDLCLNHNVVSSCSVFVVVNDFDKIYKVVEGVSRGGQRASSARLVKVTNHRVSSARLVYELELARLARELEQKKIKCT